MAKKSVSLPLIIGLIFISTSNVKAFSYVNETFLPYRGASHIKEDATSRYTYQFAKWNVNGKKELKYGNDTYEHETLFYNYDDDAYGKEPLSETSWWSNFPDPYLDTQALDGNNEYNIAVGSFDPNEIVVGNWYSYWVRFPATDSAGSYYKISGQKGYSSCEFSPWCVANEQAAIVIPYKDPLKAPESNRGYRYEYDYDDDNKNYAATSALGWWNTGVIENEDDVDYFKFTLPSSQTVDFILKISQLGNLDYDVKILDSNLQTVAASYNGLGKDEVFSKYLSAGDYYVKIYSYSGSNDINTYNFIAY